MRYKIAKALIIFWTAFISVGAFIGGISMLVKPDGSILHMEEMLPYFQLLPFADVLFKDYLFPGIALIIVNGITNALACTLVIMNKKVGFILGPIFGFTLMLWIIIQFVIFPPNILDTLYFIFGILQLLCGYFALVSYNQKYFKFDEGDYPNVNKGSKTLVVYFSRLRYTKKIAYIKANELGADIEEIKTKERTEGTLGFWWCGRFGMHHWAMDTFPLEKDLSTYDKIIIVTPIWVFNICPPIRDFMRKNKDVLSKKKVEMIYNHFNPWLPRCAIKEAREYANVISITSKTTMLGHTFK